MAALATSTLQAVIDNRTADASKRARRIIRNWVGASDKAKIVIDPHAIGIELDGKIVKIDPMTAEGALVLARHQQREALSRRFGYSLDG